MRVCDICGGPTVGSILTYNTAIQNEAHKIRNGTLTVDIVGADICPHHAHDMLSKWLEGKK